VPILWSKEVGQKSAYPDIRLIVEGNVNRGAWAADFGVEGASLGNPHSQTYASSSVEMWTAARDAMVSVTTVWHGARFGAC
jgi:hypothetical protein